MKTNILWKKYPDLCDMVVKKSLTKQLITTKSKRIIKFKCKHCQGVFSIKPEKLCHQKICPKCSNFVIKPSIQSLEKFVRNAIMASSSYLEYENVIKRQNFTRGDLGMAREIFAEMYFKVHRKQYKVKEYISYSLTKDCMQKLVDLGLPKQDLGTDAVIVHTDGKVSLIQVKWRSNSKCIHTRSVFYGMAIDALVVKKNKSLKHLYLFSNVIEKSNTLPNEEMFKYILSDTLQKTNWEFMKLNAPLCSIKSVEVPRKRIAPPYKARKWVKDGVRPFVMKEFDNYSYACQVVAACGSGKTLCAYDLLTNFADSYCALIVTPSLQLLSQWYNVFATYLDCEFLLVGSQFDDDGAESPFTLTTDENEIRKVITKRSGDLVVISTYNSLQMIYNAMKKNKQFRFTISFADEAHLTTGGGRNSLICKDDFPTSHTVFLTATPRIYNGDDENILSMDDKDIYGDRFTYSCRQAIEDGFVNDYEILIVTCENTEELNETHRYELYSKGLIKSINDHGIKRLLVASGSHDTSKKFYEEFIKHFDGRYNVILMPENANARDKEEAIQSMRDRPTIIFNVKVFNLGTDIPELEAVFFNGRKSSPIDIVQTAMRPLRVHQDKKSFIMLPVIVEDGEIESNYMTDVIIELAKSDEAIKDEIKDRLLGSLFGSVGRSKGSNRIVFDCEIEGLDVLLFDKFGENYCFKWWIERYKLNELVKYPSPNHQSRNFCDNQRRLYGNKNLSQEKQESLEELKWWTWSIVDQRKKHDIVELLNTDEEVRKKISSFLGKEIGSNFKKETSGSRKADVMNDVLAIQVKSAKKGSSSQINRSWTDDIIKSAHSYVLKNMCEMPLKDDGKVDKLVGNVLITNKNYRQKIINKCLSELDACKEKILNDVFRGKDKNSSPDCLVIISDDKTYLYKIDDIIEHFKNETFTVNEKGTALKLGLLSLQRKGGDYDNKSSNQLQFKIVLSSLSQISKKLQIT